MRGPAAALARAHSAQEAAARHEAHCERDEFVAEPRHDRALAAHEPAIARLSDIRSRDVQDSMLESRFKSGTEIPTTPNRDRAQSRALPTERVLGVALLNDRT